MQHLAPLVQNDENGKTEAFGTTQTGKQVRHGGFLCGIPLFAWVVVYKVDEQRLERKETY